MSCNALLRLNNVIKDLEKKFSIDADASDESSQLKYFEYDSSTSSEQDSPTMGTIVSENHHDELFDSDICKVNEVEILLDEINQLDAEFVAYPYKYKKYFWV